MWCTLDRTYGESWSKTINSHNSPSYQTAWILNFERILSKCQNQQESLTYGWDLKVVIYPYRLDHCWWRMVAPSILNRDTKLSHKIEIVCFLGWSKGHVIMKSVVTIIPLVEFDIVDPHFSRASSLDRRDSLFICEKLIFKKVGVATYFFLF